MARGKSSAGRPSSRKAANVSVDQATEQIVGLFVLAFGRGVPVGVHTRKEVISAIRDALYNSVKMTVQKGQPNGAWELQWQRESNTVLNFMQSVGNLAARLAFKDGQRTILNANDFKTAFTLVRVEHGFSPDQAGDWCQ